MKVSKKTKIAIITFVVLGVAGVSVLKLKSFIDKKRKTQKKKSGVINVLLDVPSELK